MRPRAIDPINFAIGLAAMGSLLLVVGFNLSGIVEGRAAWPVALLFTAAIPGLIDLLGMVRPSIREMLPRYWMICYLVSISLIVAGGAVRAWHHLRAP